MIQLELIINNDRPTGQKQLLDGRTVENKGKLILTGLIKAFYLLVSLK